MKLGIVRLRDTAILPQYHSAGAACFDIHADLEDTKLLMPRGSLVVPTGLAFNIPEGWVLNIFSRSGHGFKAGVRLVNAVGVIDCDYTGELRIGLHNDGDQHFTVVHGDRIAQGMLLPALRLSLIEDFEVKTTERGSKGYGSTGR